MKQCYYPYCEFCHIYILKYKSIYFIYFNIPENTAEKWRKVKWNLITFLL